MERFGSDKPDLRFAMELVDLAPALTGADGAPASGFRVFDETLAGGGRVKAIAAPGMGGATRREIDELTELAKRFGAKGLVHLAVQAGGELHGPIAKFLSRRHQAAVLGAAGAAEGDLILVVADAADTANDVLGRLRVELGGRLGLADPDELAYCWVHRFPMYQWDAEGKRWDATHNPFSGVVPEDEALLTTVSGEPRRALAGGPRRPGSGDAVRHRAQRLGAGRRLGADLDAATSSPGASTCRATRREQMQERFGAMLEAFEFGAPPHGGIALGIDRWAALLSHQTNIREVMAFPKTQSGSDLDARGAVRPGGAAVRGARAAVRRRPRAALSPWAESGVRALRAEDAPAFEALVARARAAGELAASSDPDGALLRPVRAAEPGPGRRSPRPTARRRLDRPRGQGRGRGARVPAAGDRPARSSTQGARSRAAAAATNLILGVLPDDAAGRAFLEAAGFAFHSTLWDLRAAARRADRRAGLAGRRDRPRHRPGPATSPAFVGLFNAAFATHADAAPDGPRAPCTGTADESQIRDEDIARRRARTAGSSGSRRPSPRRLAEGGVEPDAEIWTIGVRPDRAGPRPRAPAAAGGRRATCADSASRTVDLSVNGRNPAALGLYESEGFRRVATRDRWARPVDPAS